MNTSYLDEGTKKKKTFHFVRTKVSFASDVGVCTWMARRLPHDYRRAIAALTYFSTFISLLFFFFFFNSRRKHLHKT